MAILVEMWEKEIVGNLYDEGSVLSLAVDHSQFVNGHTVHVPNAGAKGTVQKNRSSFPATVGSRVDVDLTYSLDEYSLDPIRVGDVEELETSYQKRQSVITEGRAALHENVARDTVEKWCKGSKTNVKKGAGDTVKNWLKKAAKQFDEDKVSKKDRYVMLTTAHYYDFLDTLSDNEALAFSRSADVAKGTLGEYFGFTFSDQHILPPAVDMLAWQKNSVSTALGGVIIYEDEDSPTMYGDVISGAVRAGGAVIRNDGKGVFVVNATGQPIS